MADILRKQQGEWQIVWKVDKIGGGGVIIRIFCKLSEKAAMAGSRFTSITNLADMYIL
jgi:hypothetical protein